MKLCLRSTALTVILVSLFVSCSQGPAEKKAPVSAPMAQTVALKPEIYLYCTFYDAVLLRETPDLKGKMIAKLPMGDFLEGAGEKSGAKFEATLGGVVWHEPFLKATHLTPEEKSGWIFGGAVETVYAGTRSGSPNLGDLTKFGKYLSALDPKKLTSGEQAWSFIKNNYAQASGSLADALYLMLERFLRRMESEGMFYEMTEKMSWTDEDMAKIYKDEFDMSKSPILKSIDAAGFRLITEEGMVFPVIDRKKMLDFFGKNVTPGMKRYLEQNWAELEEPSMSDAHVAIELDKLADRCVFWEDFNTDYPYFTRRVETEEHQNWPRLIFVNGLIFNEETKEPYPEYTKAWAYILQKYPNTQLGKDIAAFTGLLAAEGNKKTAKVEAFQQAYAEKYNGE